MGMRRVAALGAGFAITLTAFGGFAAEPATPASAQSTAPAALASAAQPAAKPDTNPDALNMVPPAGPGVFSAQKKGAGLQLTVTGHKFTSQAEIENYLAWQAAQQT